MKYEYDVAVIGGGAAGLTASGVATALGAKAILIEGHRLGGDCTWTGCVPSKAILKSAKVAQYMREAGTYGIESVEPKVNFRDVVGRIHSIRQHVYDEADAPDRLERFGVETMAAWARFVDPHTLELTKPDGSKTNLTARIMIIASGSRAFVPPIDGLTGDDPAPYLTNESIFELEQQPKRLAVIGGGPIGSELAQAFHRLGSKVRVFERGKGVLGKDNPELTPILLRKLQAEGIEFELESDVKRVEKRDSGVRLHYEGPGGEQAWDADQVLVAVGRRANVSGLDLDAAGVKTDRRGVIVNDKCRTNVRHIYAIGDVAGRYQFTHYAEHMAKIAVTNALIRFPQKMDMNSVPWATYTEPEMAHVGLTREELEKRGTKYQVYRFPFTMIDRAITESETEGWIHVFARSWDGKIYGVDILGSNAGEMIGEYALAVKNGVSLRKMADTIHAYPTWGLGNRRAADQWYVQKQSPTFVRLLQGLFGYKGPVPPPPDPSQIV